MGRCINLEKQLPIQCDIKGDWEQAYEKIFESYRMDW